ncbi:hypothetical protein [Methylocystis bryophila]|uniref:Uncharacterized protein n=1 Tax=Methylocystis bryophila TaxID=655015 RepID=A0A1W6MV83_9HYPH|nr:hypothetical protein [Methylocystis bryophila]ARN81518.1 hypothetical protein B1812_11030 [Methylocystis bryophila]BDV37538.1 hypothetical protein DSM21852_07910 [Methylocystis bryophila]
MPLMTLWSTSPAAVDQFTIEQVVATAGDGVLKDGSVCSSELRGYLSQVPSAKLESYVERCLGSPFPKGGMVLQDIVNELGRRLDYRVTNGRYQGISGAIGFDGIWLSPEGHSIVAEVKTTDAYRISLDTIAAYRDKLLAGGQITKPASILIVVGRDDTGELEAQVRGSRHAWDIRLISADALVKLVKLKESADGPETGRKIRSLLTPMEYTRLDGMIDVMFTTATDVEQSSQVIEPDTEETTVASATKVRVKGTWEFTDSKLLQGKREEIIAALSKKTGTKLIRKSASLYWDSDHTVRIACTISKRYTAKGAYRYWYAYHPAWDAFLSEGSVAFLVLGCMDLQAAFAVPFDVMHSLRDALNITELESGTMYWHVHLTKSAEGISMLLPKKGTPMSLESYRVPLVP